MSSRNRQEQSTFDYIIVGGGSAGCVLANRLSADKNRRVLLLEAGGRDWSPFIHVPAAIIKAIGNPAMDWCFLADPDDSRNGKRDLWPAGKTLGGSSSINGMLYVRGNPADYDRWSDNGCAGWAYKDVLPYFRKLENTSLGDPDLRGRSGPMAVNPLRSRHPLADVFVEAAIETGIPLNQDYNGSQQDGVAYTQVTQKRGQRYSASRAYLWPARKRQSLTVKTRAQVHRVIVENGRARGVEFVRSGKRQTASATGCVILSAGVIGSPKILMHSGIGPADHLETIGVTPLIDQPSVGQNLADHPEGMVGIDVNVSTYNTEINSPKIALHGLNWLFRGRGPATSPYPHAVAFLKSDASLDSPDIQVQLGPYAFSFSEEGVVPYPRPAISAAVNLSYPRNRGCVKLASADPEEPPVIQHDLLGDARDIKELTAACRQVRAIFASQAFDDYRVAERLPGHEVQSDDDWAAYLRKTAFLGYHGIGTCGMGHTQEHVVDAELRVRGIDGLRVVDASVIPDLISGNTNATVLMMAERASDLIAAAGNGLRK